MSTEFEYVPSTPESELTALAPFFEAYKEQRSFRNLYLNDPLSSGDERQEPNNYKYVDVEFFPESMQAAFLAESPASTSFIDHLTKFNKNIIRISRRVNTRTFDYNFTYIQYPGIYRNDKNRDQYAVQRSYFGTLVILGAKGDVDSEYGETIPFSVRATIYNANESASESTENDGASDGPELTLGFVYDENYIYIFPKAFMPYRYIPVQHITDPTKFEYLDIYSLLRLKSPVYTDPDWDYKEAYRAAFTEDADFGVNFEMLFSLKDMSHGFDESDITIITPDATLITTLHSSEAMTTVLLSPNTESLVRLDGIGVKSKKTLYRPNERTYEFFSHQFKDESSKESSVQLYEQSLFVSLADLMDDGLFLGLFTIGVDKYALIKNRATKEVSVFKTDRALSNFDIDYSFFDFFNPASYVYASKMLTCVMTIGGVSRTVVILYGLRGFYILDTTTKRATFIDTAYQYSNLDVDGNRLDFYNATSKDSYTFASFTFTAPAVTTTFKLPAVTNLLAQTGVAANTVDLTWEWSDAGLPVDPNKQIAYEIYQNNILVQTVTVKSATITMNIAALDRVTVVVVDQRAAFAFLPSLPVHASVGDPLDPILLSASTFVPGSTSITATMKQASFVVPPPRSNVYLELAVYPCTVIAGVVTPNATPLRTVKVTRTEVVFFFAPSGQYRTVLEGLTPNRLYQLKMTVKDANGIYLPSPTVTATVKTQRIVLSAPTGLYHVVTDTIADIYWDRMYEPIGSRLKYEIRKTDSPTIVWSGEESDLPRFMYDDLSLTIKNHAQLKNLPYQKTLNYAIRVVDMNYSDTSFYAPSPEVVFDLYTAMAPIPGLEIIDVGSDGIIVKPILGSTYDEANLDPTFDADIKLYVSKNSSPEISPNDVEAGTIYDAGAANSEVSITGLAPASDYYIKAVTVSGE